MPRNSAPPQVRHRLILSYFTAHRNLRSSTKTSTRSSLNRWAEWCEQHAIDIRSATSEQVDDYLDKLQHQDALAPATVKANQDRLRWFYNWCAAEGELIAPEKEGKKKKKPVNPMLKVRTRTADKPIQEHITQLEYAQLMKACSGTDPVSRRNAAMLAVLRYGGLRRGELVGLDLDSYRYSEDGENVTLKVGTATHRTKTGRQRIVPLHPDAVDAMEAYLRKRGEEEGPLFLSTSSADGRLTPSGASQMLGSVRKAAGISRSIGVHEFRRAWASYIKELGVSDPDLMIIAGWEDPTMVYRYTRHLDANKAQDAFRKAWEKDAKKSYRPRLRRVD